MMLTITEVEPYGAKDFTRTFRGHTPDGQQFKVTMPLNEQSLRIIKQLWHGYKPEIAFDPDRFDIGQVAA